MAAKKSVKKKPADAAPENRILIQLSRRAKREVDKLLKRSEAGTITGTDLSSGLKEAGTSLKQMRDYITATLDEMSALRKLAESKSITKKQLDTELVAVRRLVKLMFNHGNGDHPHH